MKTVHDRALEFVKELNSRGWVINEQMADQFTIFAKAECTRVAEAMKAKMHSAVNTINWKEL
jgi:hypothetical protein